MIKQNVYLLLQNLDQFNNPNMFFSLSIDLSDWYLLQLTVLLKHDFNFESSFALSWIDKVTTQT